MKDLLLPALLVIVIISQARKMDKLKDDLNEKDAEVNAWVEMDYKSYHIDLPEEIEAAKAGDLLIINYISRDSISLGFNH